MCSITGASGGPRGREQLDQPGNRAPNPELRRPRLWAPVTKWRACCSRVGSAGRNSMRQTPPVGHRRARFVRGPEPLREKLQGVCRRDGRCRQSRGVACPPPPATGVLHLQLERTPAACSSRPWGASTMPELARKPTRRRLFFPGDKLAGWPGCRNGARGTEECGMDRNNLQKQAAAPGY